MKRCVIFGGAGIAKEQPVRSALRPDDYIICCDSGLTHAETFGFTPDLIIGDFDSHENPHLPVETIVLPREKDDTDTAYAVKEALRRGFTDFLMAGVIGQRPDHTLANISLLLLLQKAGAQAVMLDDYAALSLIVPGMCAQIPDRYPYFSLLAFGGPAEGVTITGAKYPLTDGHISCDYQYAVSNEVLCGQTAQVSLTGGTLLLVKIFEKD